jgi:crossover junction endodeoxyribonuclease RuvC
MIILGVDPGTAITGYGFVRVDDDQVEMVTYGAITTPSEWSMARRLGHIHRELAALIAEHHPTDTVIEKLFFSKNVRTAMSVGQARGVALLAAEEAGLPIHEYTPLQIKQAIAGYGRADKNQVQQMVKLLLQLESVPQPDDAADALAIAICHAHSAKFRQAMSAE